VPARGPEPDHLRAALIGGLPIARVRAMRLTLDKRRRGGRRCIPALVGAILAMAVACRRTPERAEPPQPAQGASPAEHATPPVPPAPEGGDFTMADLAAATRLDARLQRVMALAGEYKAALTFDRGPRLSEHTDQIAKALDEAVPALDRALQEVRDPRDRERAAPLVAAARRWPAQLLAARDELIASPHPATKAADALAATDEQVAGALAAYRAFRAAWRISDSPAEPDPVLGFLRARRALEEVEADLGQRIQGSGAGAEDQAGARARLDGAVGEARKAAELVDDARKPAAKRFVDSEAQALEALLALAAPGSADERRARDELAYQLAKVGALEALADYVASTAGAGHRP
jgi:hypothetical protein